MQDFISIQFPMSDYLITVSPLGTLKSKGLDLVRSFQSTCIAFFTRTATAVSTECI